MADAAGLDSYDGLTRARRRHADGHRLDRRTLAARDHTRHFLDHRTFLPPSQHRGSWMPEVASGRQSGQQRFSTPVGASVGPDGPLTSPAALTPRGLAPAWVPGGVAVSVCRQDRIVPNCAPGGRHRPAALRTSRVYASARHMTLALPHSAAERHRRPWTTERSARRPRGPFGGLPQLMSKGKTLESEPHSPADPRMDLLPGPAETPNRHRRLAVSRTILARYDTTVSPYPAAKQGQSRLPRSSPA